MSEWTNTIIAVVVAIIGLATLSVILSKQSNATQVISTAGQALSSVIGAAVAPVSGLSTSVAPLQNYVTGSDYGGGGSIL